MIRGVLSTQSQDKNSSAHHINVLARQNALQVKVTLDSSFNTKRKCCCFHWENFRESSLLFPCCSSHLSDKCEVRAFRRWPVENVIITVVLCMVFFQCTTFLCASKSLLDVISSWFWKNIPRLLAKFVFGCDLT